MWCYAGITNLWMLKLLISAGVNAAKHTTTDYIIRITIDIDINSPTIAAVVVVVSSAVVS